MAFDQNWPASLGTAFSTSNSLGLKLTCNSNPKWGRPAHHRRRRQPLASPRPCGFARGSVGALERWGIVALEHLVSRELGGRCSCSRASRASRAGMPRSPARWWGQEQSANHHLAKEWHGWVKWPLTAQAITFGLSCGGGWLSGLRAAGPEAKFSLLHRTGVFCRGSSPRWSRS